MKKKAKGEDELTRTDDEERTDAWGSERDGRTDGRGHALSGRLTGNERSCHHRVASTPTRSLTLF